MKRLRFLPTADADLKDIYVRIAQEDGSAAVRLIERLVASVRRLGEFPDSAPLKPEIGPGVRSLVVGRYLLLYRVGPNSVDVVRVVHGARDMKGLIEPSADPDWGPEPPSQESR